MPVTPGHPARRGRQREPLAGLTMTTTKESIEAVAAELGLSMVADYQRQTIKTPVKRSELWLKWRVTICRQDKQADRGRRVNILTTDYTAGCGHCPSYKPGNWSVDEQRAIVSECETGQDSRRRPILPSLADVLSSLCSDADAIDAGSFEEWAGNLGYDPDSRKAEATYRECLDIALKLRWGLGEQGFARLREECQGY
jgi:hypothetical protein